MRLFTRRSLCGLGVLGAIAVLPVVASSPALASGPALAGSPALAGTPALAGPGSSLAAPAGGVARPPAALAARLTAAAKAAPAAQGDSIVVVNSASFEGADNNIVPSGAFLTLYTTQSVTDEPATSYPFPGTLSTPHGLTVQSDNCGNGLNTNLGILFAGPSGFGGTQINIYYPNAYQGGRNVEPFVCAGFDTTQFTVHATNGAILRKLVQIIRVRPGIFTADSSGTGAPAGYHLNAWNGRSTPITACNADLTGTLCPVATHGIQNFLVVFTTGAEMMGCPDFAVPCTLSFGSPTFYLGAPGTAAGAGVPQGLTFFGWAGFVGQEQANVQINPGTGAGEYVLSMTVPRFFFSSRQTLRVKLGSPTSA